MLDGPDADAFTKAAIDALTDAPGQTMLTDGIAAAYRAGRDQIEGTAGVKTLLSTQNEARTATPYLFGVTGTDWLENAALSEEVFGRWAWSCVPKIRLRCYKSPAPLKDN